LSSNGNTASEPGGKFGEDFYSPSFVEGKAAQFVVLSGCSGGGKSTLLAELGRRGFPIYEEAGRQVIKEQLYIGGDAIPSGNVMQFVELTISRSIYNLISAARGNQITFFDRGIVDQIAGFDVRKSPIPGHLAAAAARFRYHETVFMMPPWPEIFSNDRERRHSFADSLAGYGALLRTYERFGYRAITVPKLEIRARADFIIDNLATRALGGAA
jgi:predicted ATPase